MLAGGGIRGGMVYGASDKNGAYVKDKPVSPEDFGATLYHVLGVPPETRLGADGFTHPVSTGQPIAEAMSGRRPSRARAISQPMISALCSTEPSRPERPS